MARLNYAVQIVDATGLELRTLEGIAAMDAFEVRADEIVKAAMNEARKALRQAAPTRTRKLQRSLRVSKIRRKYHPEIRPGRIVVGYQVTTGSKLFYGPITDQREDTRVARWFTKTLERLQEASDFKSWQDELTGLFAEVIRAEFKELTRNSLRARIIGSFPRAKLIFTGSSGSLIRSEINADKRGRGR